MRFWLVGVRWLIIGVRTVLSFSVDMGLSSAYEPEVHLIHLLNHGNTQLYTPKTPSLSLSICWISKYIHVYFDDIPGFYVTVHLIDLRRTPKCHVVFRIQGKKEV